MHAMPDKTTRTFIVKARRMNILAVSIITEKEESFLKVKS